MDALNSGVVHKAENYNKIPSSVHECLGHEYIIVFGRRFMQSLSIKGQFLYDNIFLKASVKITVIFYLSILVHGYDLYPDQNHKPSG